MNPILSEAFAALDGAGVDWCLLRGAADLEQPAGDVDLLVSPRHAAALDRALGDAGFVHQRTWGGGSQRFFLGRDAAGAHVLLHGTTRVAFGRWYQLDTGTAESVVGRRQRHGEVWVASPEDELWTSLLHCLLDKGRVTEKHRARLPLLVRDASATDDVAVAVARRAGSAWDPAAVLDLVRAGDWAALDALPPGLAAAWRGGAPVRTRASAARNAASLWSRKLREPITRPGTSVALLAPDGAGKSTLASSLGDAVPVPVRVLYLGLYGAAMRRPPVALPGAGFATRVLTVRWRWLVGRYHRMRRRVVVLDRHPVEALLEGGGLRRRLLARSAPLPDLVVVLDAPGEVLHRRKGEHDVATLEARRQAYRRLAASLPNALVVDADRPPAEVVADVAAAIWDHQRRRG